MRGRVLVIEDDQDISLGIRTVLSRQGLDVAGAPDGRQGLRAFHTARPDPFDLVVLDIGLPSMDGWAVLERIRDLSDVPVLILTAHGNEGDKVRGLHGGADDYLTKPFGNRELAARVEALLRRPRAKQPLAEVYDDGRLRVSLDVREVSVGGAPVALTPTEFRLLAALVRHPGSARTTGSRAPRLRRSAASATVTFPRPVRVAGRTEWQTPPSPASNTGPGSPARHPRPA